MSHHDAAPTEELGPSAVRAPILAHLTLDPALDRLTVIEFGSVWDGQPDEQMLGLEEEERIIFLLREGEKDGPVIGFMIDGPHGFDPEDLNAGQIWDSPRFTVPVLGLTDACVGEIVLVVQSRYAEHEPTTDSFFFYMAVNAAHEDDDPELAEGYWRMALEAGDMKARFGLGYTLFHLKRFREAYDHLRIYTELTPHNGWAWCWLGRACQELGETHEAAGAYRRAVELEQEGSYETDADERLTELLGG